jgi:hypothetical protein
MLPLLAIGAALQGAALVGKGINMFRSPYKGVQKQIERQYALADTMGQRDLQGQLMRANRSIGARMASVGAVDPQGYAQQVASDRMFSSLADLRGELGQGKAGALANVASQQAEYRNQAINDFLGSMSNTGQTMMLGGLLTGGQPGQMPAMKSLSWQAPSYVAPSLSSLMMGQGQSGSFAPPEQMLRGYPSEFPHTGLYSNPTSYIGPYAEVDPYWRQRQRAQWKMYSPDMER